jgi:hypothetical protein
LDFDRPVFRDIFFSSLTCIDQFFETFFFIAHVHRPFFETFFCIAPVHRPFFGMSSPAEETSIERHRPPMKDRSNIHRPSSKKISRPKVLFLRYTAEPAVDHLSESFPRPPDMVRKKNPGKEVRNTNRVKDHFGVAPYRVKSKAHRPCRSMFSSTSIDVFGRVDRCFRARRSMFSGASIDVFERVDRCFRARRSMFSGTSIDVFGCVDRCFRDEGKREKKASDVNRFIYYYYYH